VILSLSSQFSQPLATLLYDVRVYNSTHVIWLVEFDIIDAGARGSRRIHITFKCNFLFPVLPLDVHCSVFSATCYGERYLVSILFPYVHCAVLHSAHLVFTTFVALMYSFEDIVAPSAAAQGLRVTVTVSHHEMISCNMMMMLYM